MARMHVHDVPVLQRRSHPHPRTGACLVEIASTLPGGPWTDHPAGVEPVLSILARLVNDATSDDQRRALLALAPWLITGPDANTDQIATLTATLAARTALPYADASTAAQLAAAIAALDTPPASARWPWRQRTTRRRQAVRSVRVAVRTLTRSANPDQALRTLLIDAINLTRTRDGLPPLDIAPVSATRYPATLPVDVQIRLQAEWTHYHCTAVLDDWPLQLTEAWTTRTDELRRTARQTTDLADTSLVGAIVDRL